jgi:hypothetical protein
MSDLKLAPIEPARISTEAVAWNNRSNRNPQQRRGRPSVMRTRLIAAMAPGASPESCEVDYVVDAEGVLMSLIVRDTVTGAELARISPRQLSALVTGDSPSGLLFEQRG